MKLGQSICLILMASSAAMAQTTTTANGLQSGPAKLPAGNGTPSVQTQTTKAAKPSPVSVKPADPTKPKSTAATASQPAKPSGPVMKSVSGTSTPKFVDATANTSNTAHKPTMKTVSKVAVTPKASIIKAVEPQKVPELAAARRDPFVNPIVRVSGIQGSGCDVGKKCLMVDQIALKGIVKSGNDIIALVENSSKRAYFLHENDPVFNGTVVKITPDTIIFRENITDRFGKATVREVTKKVNAPVV